MNNVAYDLEGKLRIMMNVAFMLMSKVWDRRIDLLREGKSRTIGFVFTYCFKQNKKLSNNLDGESLIHFLEKFYCSVV